MGNLLLAAAAVVAAGTFASAAARTSHATEEDQALCARFASDSEAKQGCEATRDYYRRVMEASLKHIPDQPEGYDEKYLRPKEAKELDEKITRALVEFAKDLIKKV